MKKFVTVTKKMSQLFTRKKPVPEPDKSQSEDESSTMAANPGQIVVRVKVPSFPIHDFADAKPVWDPECEAFDLVPTNLMECLSQTSSTSSEKVGFNNRTVVTRKDGLLYVSVSDDDENEKGSMSSIFTSVMGGQMDDLENIYKRHRDSIVNKDGFISTPLHVVKELVKRMKQKIHIEHYVLQSPGKRNKIYRVDILVGPLRGVGQCTRKQLARQLAAIDILEKLQSSENGLRPMGIPKFGLLPGWRLDSMIYGAFDEICRANDLPSPEFTVEGPPENKIGKCTAICRVGDHATQAQNDHPWLAKKLAAKKMYELVAGTEFPWEATPTGNEVIGLSQMRLLGFTPKLSSVKRKWMMDYRLQDSQVVVPEDEPDDNDLEIVEDLESQFQLQHSKKLKLSTLKEVLKITVANENKDNAEEHNRNPPVDHHHHHHLPRSAAAATPTTEKPPPSSSSISAPTRRLVRKNRKQLSISIPTQGRSFRVGCTSSTKPGRFTFSSSGSDTSLSVLVMKQETSGGDGEEEN